MKHSIRVLTQKQVARVLSYPMAIRAVREAFKVYAKGHAVMPAKVYLGVPQGDFRAMPAYIGRPEASGLKWVNVHPKNRAAGLPTVMAVILLNEARTGKLLAVMEAGLITKFRTAAAAAVAAHALARKNSREVALIGCGAQADAQLLALAAVHPFKRVRAWGFLPGEARAFCRAMRRKLPAVLFEASDSVKACVSGADIVITVTPSRKPLILREWISPGTHINAVGADAPGKQELDPAILKAAKVIVDEREQSIHGGEINVAVSRGLFKPAQIHASLGEVLLGRRSGRRSAKEITVFDSTGLAIHDVALGHEVLRVAQRKAVGKRIVWPF